MNFLIESTIKSAFFTLTKGRMKNTIAETIKSKIINRAYDKPNNTAFFGSDGINTVTIKAIIPSIIDI
jgi:hypothetical protein